MVKGGSFIQGARVLASLWLILILASCAPRSRSGFSETQVFPPHRLLPLRVAITEPLAATRPGPADTMLATWSQSPARRALLERCTWQAGLQNMVATLIPGSEFIVLGDGRHRLAAAECGVTARIDSLGGVEFKLVGKTALDLARRRGWTHLVVPQELEFINSEKTGLRARVAIVDVQNEKIVWQGLVDSRNISPARLGSDRHQQPGLTSYEESVYLFFLDLADVFGRRLNNPAEDRATLALPCQDSPPVF